jgi:hypothetical protein
MATFVKWIQNKIYPIGFYPVIINNKPTIAYQFDNGKWKTYFDENRRYSKEDFDLIGSLLNGHGRIQYLQDGYSDTFGKPKFQQNNFYWVKMPGLTLEWTIGYFNPSMNRNQPWTTFFTGDTTFSSNAFECFGDRIDLIKNIAPEYKPSPTQKIKSKGGRPELKRTKNPNIFSLYQKNPHYIKPSDS